VQGLQITGWGQDPGSSLGSSGKGIDVPDPGMKPSSFISVPAGTIQLYMYATLQLVSLRWLHKSEHRSLFNFSSSSTITHALLAPIVIFSHSLVSQTHALFITLLQSPSNSNTSPKQTTVNMQFFKSVIVLAIATMATAEK